jgi:iron complex outermembrane receptor protein
MTTRYATTSTLSILSTFALASGTPLALAQTPTPNRTPQAEGLEEVVVTAQKRVERLSDTTVSAAVVSADRLVLSGVTNLDDLGKAVPSLGASPSNGMNRSGFSMRGISTTVITAGAPSGVAVMVDGVTLAPESMGARQLGDVENVEVLRGPQATLGGRTASAGVVNMVTRAPSRTFGANVSATFTDDDEQRLQGFITGPITDHLAFSAAGYGSSTEYPTRNLATGNNDRERAYGGRGKLLYQPTEDLDVALTAAASNTKNRGTFANYIVIDPTANFRGSPLLSQSVALPGITVGRDNLDYRVIGDPNMNGTDHFYSLVVNWRLGGFALSSITARQEEDRTLVFDNYDEAADSAAILIGAPYTWNMKQTSRYDVRTTTQEFKLDSPQLGVLHFLTGLYFDHDVTGFDFVRASYLNKGAGPPPFSAYRVPDTKTYAAYGRADWTLVPEKLQLITGLRVNRDDIEYIYSQRNTAPPAPQIVPFTRTGSASETSTVGDLTLRYRFNPDVMAYASYTRGYKPSIWNLDGTVTPTNTFVPVKREDIDAYEIGLKGTFLDNRLSLNAAIFDTFNRNFQVQTFDPNAVSATFAIANAGKVQSRGVELDARAALPGDFRVTSSIAFVDARYDRYDAANCYGTQTAAQGCLTAPSGNRYQVLTGQRLPGAPRWKGNIGVDKRFHVNLPVDLVVNGNYVYQSEVGFDPNLSPFAVQGAYGIFNLGVGVIDRDNRYDVTLFMNNAFDKHYVSGMIDQTARWGGKLALTGNWSRDAERYAGIRLNMRF